MAQAWFFTQYDVDVSGHRPRRTLPINAHMQAVWADGGNQREIELPNNHLLIGVRASQATINVIAADPKFQKIPQRALKSTLADLTGPQRSALRAKLNDMGYSNSDISARLGGTDLSTVTLWQVFRYAARRWFKPTHFSTWASPDVPEFETVEREHPRVRSDADLDALADNVDSGFGG